MELPPGFRFHPTDEELVTFYLANKVRDPRFEVRTICVVDFNECEPWDLPGKAKVGEKEWYFYSLRDRKYPTGTRTNRATKTGYWKATGKDRDVMNSGTHSLVGMKKTLVFYMGRAPRGVKTNWIMHEYRLERDSTSRFHGQQSLGPKQDEWVICRVFQKFIGNKKSGVTHGDSPYQLIDSHSALQRDSSPNPAVTDSGECDACTGTDSCYNCQDSYPQDVSLALGDVATALPVQWVHTMPNSKVPGSISMVPSAMDTDNLMKETYYNQNAINSGMLNHASIPQSIFAHPSTPMRCFDNLLGNNRIRAKQEASYTSNEGEDEAQSSGKLNLDCIAWPSDNVLYDQEIPCDSPLSPLQTVTEESGQLSCLTDGTFGDDHQSRMLRYRWYSSLPEVAGCIDGLQPEWAY